MKLHQTVIEKLVTVFEKYGGHREEIKLKQALNELSFTVYAQQSTGNDILVLTEDIEKHRK